jgi:hypothetical protein
MVIHCRMATTTTQCKLCRELVGKPVGEDPHSDLKPIGAPISRSDGKLEIYRCAKCATAFERFVSKATFGAKPAYWEANDRYAG